MKKRTAVGSLIACSALVATAVGLSACHRHPWKMDPQRVSKVVEWKVDDALDGIHATDAQREQIQALAKEVVTDALAVRKDGMQGRREIIDELLKDDPNPERIHELMDQRVEALRAFAHRTVDLALRNHSVLTPDQRAELRAELDRRLEAR